MKTYISTRILDLSVTFKLVNLDAGSFWFLIMFWRSLRVIIEKLMFLVVSRLDFLRGQTLLELWKMD